MGVRDFHRDQVPIRVDGYYTDLLSDEAVRIITRHRGGDPFFLYLAHGAPHNPLQAPEAEIDRFRHLDRRRATYLAMCTVIDNGLGRILEALERRQIADNTLIVFLSDNGGSRSGNNKPLRGRKGDLYEGGIRVLAAARWPGRIPAGSVSETPVSYLDILPTLLDAAGATVGKDMKLDGRSALPHWQADKNAGAGPFEFYSFYEKRQKPRERLSVIRGHLKLIRRGPPILEGAQAAGTRLELYDLAKDPGEQDNLAEERPEVVTAMIEKLIAFRRLRAREGVHPMVEPFPRGWKPLPNWEPVD